MTEWKANRLRVLRAERRLTQWDVAERIGISQGTYSLWEIGRITPTEEQRDQIAAALDVSVAELLPPSSEAVAS